MLELGARVFELVVPPPPLFGESLRTRHHDVPPAIPGAYRIFLYGGSTVAGAWVKEFSFATQLDFWLKRLVPDRPVQIVNFGWNGKPSAFALTELERTIGAAPDLIIVMTSTNEFLGWKPDSTWEQFRQAVGDVLEETAVARGLRRAGKSLERFYIPTIALRLPQWVHAEDRQGEHFRGIVAAYERNVREIVSRTQAAGIPLILMTDPADLAEWMPIHRFTHDGSYDDRVAALRGRIAAGDLDAARSELASFSADYPSDAMATYLAGRIAAQAGDTAEASALFDTARETDPVVMRVLGRFNDFVRSLAADGGDGVQLADIDRVFRQASDGGLVGKALVSDNCHPTPKGSALIARELLRLMAERGVVFRSLEGLPPLERQLKIHQQAVLESQPDLTLSYLLLNAVVLMKTPFYDFDGATDYLVQASAIAPEDWRVWANLGTIAVLEGRFEQGRQQLDRAAERYGGRLRSNDRGPTPYLREAQALLSGEIERFAPAEARK